MASKLQRSSLRVLDIVIIYLWRKCGGKKICLRVVRHVMCVYTFCSEIVFSCPFGI